MALAAIDAFGRRLSCLCSCFCDLQFIRGSAVALVCVPCHCEARSTEDSAVALAAFDAFERPLSCVCPCHCDLQSIGVAKISREKQRVLEKSGQKRNF